MTRDCNTIPAWIIVPLRRRPGAPGARHAATVPIVIAFPITVTGLLDKPVNVDLDKVKIEVPQIDLPPLDLRDTKQ